MCRHDPQRTGTTSGASNIGTPVAYWKSYLGGAIAPQQLATATLQAGQESLLLASTGTVVATGASGPDLWQTKVLNIGSIVGVADVNGDTNPDLVTFSNNQVYIFSSTGAVEWAEPTGQIGSMGGVRMGDVTGDGLPDVVIQECGCCGVTSGNPGFVYSFAQGFGSPALLGTLPFSTCGSHALTLVNPTGSGALDILVADYTHFALLGGSSVSVLASTQSLGTWVDQSECYPANVDGTPGDEVICLNNATEAPGTNQRSITLLHYDTTVQPAALQVVWSKVVAPDVGGNMNWTNPVADLDGDGTFELVYATDDPTNGWETHIADALTGSDLVAPLVGQIAAGTAALEQASQLDLLTSANQSLTAWAFVRSPSPTATNRWTVAGSALTYPLPALARQQFDASNLVATDLNGDGLADLVVDAIAPSMGLNAFSGKGGASSQIGSLALPSSVGVLQTWVVPALTTKVPQIALARTDGVLNLLDGTLTPTSSGGSTVAIPFGGYYASGAWRELFHGPRVAPLDSSGHDAVLIDDSRATLLRLDASKASLAVPPTTVWESAQTFGAAVQQLDGGAPTIEGLEIVQPVTNPPQYKACSLASDGTTNWAQPLSGNPINDPMPADFNGDGIPDVAFQLGNSSNADLVTIALSGASGSPLWATQPLYPGAGGIQDPGVSLSDWNGDGVQDVFFQGSSTLVLSGVDGSQLASGGPTNVYSMAVLYDTNGDGVPEVTLNAGEWPVSLYSHDLTTALWTAPENDKPYPYSAMVQCPGSPALPMLVEGSWQNPARLKITPMNGPSLGAYSTLVLAGGAVYADETSATAAGAFLGQLTSANAHANLTGKNHPTAVVGSSDGWLYGINPCAGSLDFSVNVGAPVGEAAFGDTDGDGNDEILVTAADGYLYDFKTFSIAAPGFVYDTDPPAVTNQEVSNIVTTNRLSATWGAVTGALSYEVQVVTPSGALVSTPSWQNVGKVTSKSLTGLALKDGAKYQFAVRAVSANGPSADAISPGVTVHFPDGGTDGGPEGGTDASVDAGSDASVDAQTDSPSGLDASPDGSPAGSPEGGGCGCRVVKSSTGHAGTAALALFASGVLILRRRRRILRRRLHALDRGIA
jgi:hypothetical protein